MGLSWGSDINIFKSSRGNSNENPGLGITMVCLQRARNCAKRFAHTHLKSYYSHFIDREMIPRRVQKLIQDQPGNRWR